LYGRQQGVRIARKHISWYLDYLHGSLQFKKIVFSITDADTQLDMMRSYLQDIELKMENVA